MRKQLFIILLAFAIGTSASANYVSTQKEKGKKEHRLDVDKQLRYCNTQIHRALDLLRQKDGTYDFTMEPRDIPPVADGHKGRTLQGNVGWSCRPAIADEWCGGFWPGILWMDYSVFGDSSVLKAAEGYTEALRHIAYKPIFDHDIGFLMFCSFGKKIQCLSQMGVPGSQLTFQSPLLGREERGEAKNAILASADSLATLFNPMVGTILSWPRNVKMFGGHNTIMDNMMNLEMMFWASKNGGNPLLYDIAVTHAKTTMQNHFRPDGSCFHVAVYDSLDGHFIKGVTHQGYADSSMWARGQSWAIYGYTMVYRYTHNPVFLKFAEKVTDVYLKRLKETSDDMVPLWDMDDPRGLKAHKDASTACVVADALLELSGYIGGEKGDYYKQQAISMLADLSTPKYLSGKRNVSFLMHSVGNLPAGSEIDYSIVYADYYYLEALLRLKELEVRS